MDLLRERLELLLHVAAHRDEKGRVHLDAGALEVGQDLHERHLHRFVDREEPLRPEPLGQGPVEPNLAMLDSLKTLATKVTSKL